ncbi:MAG: acyltransferase [Ginsengibacter sp.]
MKQRFEVLDTFRGFFSFLVALFHLANLNNSFLVQNMFVKNAYLFVDFFFVLSGFVIAYNYEAIIVSAKDLLNFFNKRFFRLFPLHLAVLLIFLVYVIGRNSFGHPFTEMQWHEYSKETFFTTLFFVNSIKFPRIDYLSWNTVSWSISAEAISYCVFGILMIVLSNYKKLKLLFYVCIVVLSYAALKFLNGDFYLFQTFQNGFLRGLVGFFTGCISFKIYMKIKDYKLSFNFASLLETGFLLVAVSTVCLGKYLSGYGFIYEIVFMGTLLIFAFERGALSKFFLSIPILKKLGKISYSIYLNQIIVLILFDIAFKKFSRANQFIDTGLVCAISVVLFLVSWWTYNNIERRFMRGIKKATKNS